MKKYIIESKGFKTGIGSSDYKKKRKQKNEDLKNKIAEMENIEFKAKKIIGFLNQTLNELQRLQGKQVTFGQAEHLINAVLFDLDIKVYNIVLKYCKKHYKY